MLLFSSRGFIYIYSSFFNEQLSKEEFEKRRAALKLETFAGVRAMRKRAQEFFALQPQKFVQGEHNEHSIGDHISNTRNAFFSTPGSGRTRPLALLPAARFVNRCGRPPVRCRTGAGDRAFDALPAPQRPPYADAAMR